MKKFIASITIVMAMIVAMFGFGPEEAFASTFNESRVAYTTEDQIREEMDLFEEWFVNYCANEYEIEVVDTEYHIYGQNVVWTATATVDGELDAESTVLSFEDVHDIARVVRGWDETARLSDWM